MSISRILANQSSRNQLYYPEILVHDLFSFFSLTGFDPAETYTLQILTVPLPPLILNWL
jgi:hypothetical protein